LGVTDPINDWSSPMSIAFDDLAASVGRKFGPSPWRDITPAQVDGFADVTDDHQWIHVDHARAQQGPFGKAIAHGYLLLGLIPSLNRDLYDVKGKRLGINYGLNRVRFPTPAPVGGRIRATTEVKSVSAVSGGYQVISQITIEVEGNAKPACVAETVVLFMR
jgi:acyl dehydratase